MHPGRGELAAFAAESEEVHLCIGGFRGIGKRAATQLAAPPLATSLSLDIRRLFFSGRNACGNVQVQINRSA
eukprot:11740980-Heterocapsa_arctica.AAC.1